MKKILPVTYPMTANYQHIASMLSILQNNPYTKPWLLNCFIQLQGHHVFCLDFDDFWILDNPVLMVDRIKQDIIKLKWNNLLLFLEDAVNQEYYLYFPVNTKYIYAYQAEGDIPHDIFLYGYDSEKELFCVADFFNGKKYSYIQITYQEMENALNFTNNEVQNFFIFDNDFLLLKDDFILKPGYKDDLDFHVDRVKASLENYLNATPTQNWYKRFKISSPANISDYKTGIECYDILRTHIDYIKETGTIGPQWAQAFMGMHDHKKIMGMRIEYMKKNNYIYDSDKWMYQYKILENKMLTARNLILKYSIKPDPLILAKVQDIIDEVEKTEKYCLEKLIKDIHF